MFVFVLPFLIQQSFRTSVLGFPDPHDLLAQISNWEIAGV